MIVRGLPVILAGEDDGDSDQDHDEEKEFHYSFERRKKGLSPEGPNPFFG